MKSHRSLNETELSNVTCLACQCRRRKEERGEEGEEEAEEKEEEEDRNRGEKKGGEEEKCVNWYFKTSQPQRIIPGLVSELVL